MSPTPLRGALHHAQKIALCFWLLLSFCVASVALGDEQKTQHRIAILQVGMDQFMPEMKAFLQGLEEVGYVQGKNVTIDWYTVKGDYARLPEISHQAIQSRPDVIVAENSTVALEAKRYTQAVPIVTALMGDPIGSGLVKSLAHPEGNITGLSMMVTDIAAKRLQILSEIMPGLKRIGVLRDARLPPQMQNSTIQALLDGAKILRINLVMENIDKSNDFANAFAKFKMQNVQAIYVLESGFFSVSRSRILELAATAKLPVTLGSKKWVEQGALFAYSASYSSMFRRAAYYVDRILKGTKPSELPVEQPTKFEFAVNMKTAKRLHLKIPQSVYIQATDLIE